ncbi:MAG: aldehyde dehydrogenase family protein [Actinomyces sp.]|nr:MAG: aldehyde dehydrogenase family protein [Actinomyces sp.]
MAITDKATETPSPAAPAGDHLPALVEGLRRVFDSGRTRPLSWRHEQLDGLLRLLDTEEERLVDALAADLGRPRLEGWAADIGTTANEIRHLRRHVAGWTKPRRVRLPLSSRPGRGRVVAEPLGVVAVIAPWNYPVQLLLAPLAAALAAGNVAVAKPSELAPRTSALLAELIPRHLDPEAVAVVEGDAAVARSLLDQELDHVFFTGSTRVGRIVMEAAARHLTPVTLELGGKSPVIVHDSADVEVAARRVAWGKWLNAGQTCVAPDYALVTPALRDAFVDGVAAAWRDFAGGGEARASTDFGRIVTERHTVRLAGLLTGHGGEIAVGGEVDEGERYVAPTLVVDPDPDSPLMSEEIFGPILPVVTVDDLDAAIAFVAARPRPLALYVFAGDDTVADEVIARTSSGGVCVNQVLLHITPPELPFGGVGPSGTGRYHGRSGFDTFSNLRSVLYKPQRPDPALLYPPYTRLKERIVRRFL